jgi:hypothetical protein
MEKGLLEGRAREPFAALLRSDGIRFALAARFPRPALRIAGRPHHGIGSVITAMPVVNATPAVVAARPGIVAYADLPTQASRHVPYGS